MAVWPIDDPDDRAGAPADADDDDDEVAAGEASDLRRIASLDDDDVDGGLKSKRAFRFVVVVDVVEHRFVHYANANAKFACVCYLSEV